MLDIHAELIGALRLLLALVCGALIGLERERGHRPAGLRTHTLVCVGSCLVMFCSFWAVEKYGSGGDPLRMGAQVISGIGFLGAGTIIKAGRDVRGLTTAACLWIVACIGLAIGAGYYIGSVMATALTLGTLYVFKLAERRMDYTLFELHLRARNEPDAPAAITSAIQAMGVEVLHFLVEQDRDMLRISMTVHLIHVKRVEFIGKLMNLPGVLSVTDQPE